VILYGVVPKTAVFRKELSRSHRLSEQFCGSSRTHVLLVVTRCTNDVVAQIL